MSEPTFKFALKRHQVEWLKFLCDFHLVESYNDLAKSRTQILKADLRLDKWKALFEQNPARRG